MLLLLVCFSLCPGAVDCNDLACLPACLPVFVCQLDQCTLHHRAGLALMAAASPATVFAWSLFLINRPTEERVQGGGDGRLEGLEEEGGKLNCKIANFIE